MPDSIYLVFTTCVNTAEAEVLARRLVEEKLAACASRIASVVSTYPWKGKIERSEEVQLTFKTTAAALPHLEKRLLELHSYECPEFVAIAASHVSQAYADWVRASVSVPTTPA